MANNTVNAVKNPSLANQLVQDALTEKTPEPELASITAPFNNVVTLPGGLVVDGEVITTAEVRELTGKDEEAIVKAPNVARALSVILSRGVVALGDQPVSEALLDRLLVGDRDALLLGIYRATFGNTATLAGYDTSNGEVVEVELDLLTDIPVKQLADPINDRTFEVTGKKNTFVVTLPTGATQKEIMAVPERTVSELTTVLLYNCVLEIDGRTVVSIEQIRNLGLQDRRKINEAIVSRTPGPQFEDLKVPNPDSDGEVVVPINLGTLFRL